MASGLSKVILSGWVDCALCSDPTADALRNPDTLKTLALCATCLPLVASACEGFNGFDQSEGGFVDFPNHQTINIVQAGDSITWGNNDSADGGYRRYFDQLVHGLPEGQQRAFYYLGNVVGPFSDNEGINGAGFATLQASVASWFDSGWKPRVCFVMIGTNDLPGVLADVAQGISDCVQAICDRFLDCEVYWSNIIRNLAIDPIPSQLNALLPAHATTLRGLGYNVRLVDMFTALPDASYYQDTKHPNNAKGYPAMASRWFDIYVNRNPAYYLVGSP